MTAQLWRISTGNEAFWRHSTTPGAPITNGRFLWQVTVLLKWLIRKHSPVHFSTRQRLLHRFPHKYITPGEISPTWILTCSWWTGSPKQFNQEKIKPKKHVFSGHVFRLYSCRDASHNTANRDEQQRQAHSPSTHGMMCLVATVRYRISWSLHWRYQDIDSHRKVCADMFTLGSAANLPKNRKEILRPNH